MKKLLVLLTLLIVITGCNKQKSTNEKFYLDDKYYTNGSYIELTKEELEQLQINKASYLVFTYNSYCTFKVPCDNIFEEVMKKYNISIYSLPHSIMKDTFLHDKVKFSPSIIIINKGNIIAYLDSEKQSDLSKYQDSKEFEKWLDEYIYLKK